MQGIEMICFEIISAVGTAKSLFMEALQEAKAGNYEQAEAYIKEGEETYLMGHRAHAKLIQQEASGESVQVTILLMHAEDQLMATDTIKILALEFIELYKKMN